MEEQDKRTVATLCESGLDLETIIKGFPMIPREDIMAIYEYVQGIKFEEST